MELIKSYGQALKALHIGRKCWNVLIPTHGILFCSTQCVSTCGTGCYSLYSFFGVPIQSSESSLLQIPSSLISAWLLIPDFCTRNRNTRLYKSNPLPCKCSTLDVEVCILYIVDQCQCNILENVGTYI